MAEITKLYVGDLPESVTEDFLRNDCGFGSFGEITDIIIKKKEGFKNAFAFITYKNHEDAAHAMSELNYIKLDTTPIRIMWDNWKQLVEKDSNLFINGLEKSIEVSQLHNAFANFGEILSCKIPLTNGESRGYGYIQFRHAEDAQRAIEELSDATINNQKITVTLYQKTKKSPEETFTNVYIKPLSKDKFRTKEDVEQIFSKFGDIQSIKLVDSDPTANIAMCNFRQHEDAVRAVQALNDTEIEGNKILCTRAQTKAERQKELARRAKEFRKMKAAETYGRNMFFKNIPIDVTDEEFKEYLENFGEVESCKIIRQATRQATGYVAFGVFKTKETADKFRNEFYNFKLHGIIPFFEDYKPIQEVKKKAKPYTPYAPQQQQVVTPAQASPMSMPSAPTQIGSFATFEAKPIDKLRAALYNAGVEQSKVRKILKTTSEMQAELIVSSPEQMEKWIEFHSLN